mmetsp:Transcript_27282/g.78374  ORF Transcript_27282/g.78374 Transcript_27282/m.78374 type:complete len:248 (+) Transcript_27282:368-1111(+)
MATPGMSRPREATSVATSTPRSALLLAVSARNFSSASSRTHCSLLLWIARHQMPRPLPWSILSTSSQRHFMLVKTMAVSPGPSSFLISSFRRAGFSSGSITFTTCFTLVFAVSTSPASPCPIRTCTGALAIRLRAERSTSLGHVAVKKSVWRQRPAVLPLAPPPSSGFPGLGHMPTISRMSASKPMSSIRSASSNTRYVTASTDTTGSRSYSALPLQKSNNRPGVAMRTSQPLVRSSLICSPFGAPP